MTGALRALPALCVCACASGPGQRPAAARADEILGCFDLPRGDARSHNLSGLAWDGTLLYAVSDRDKMLVEVRPRADLKGADIIGTIDLAIEQKAKWDGEGVAKVGGGFHIAQEIPPTLYSVDASGKLLGRIELPEHFQRARVEENFGIEALAVTDDGRYLFTANEEALRGDGAVASPAQGTTVRILRRDLATGAQLEVAYRTEPVFAAGNKGNCGVSDVLPLSATRVLVTERSYVEDHGNAVQLYLADLEGAEDVLAAESLAGARVVPKRLLVDVATLPAAACPPAAGPQRSPALENYEGVALGPRLADGRRVLFLVADDNNQAIQSARILVLAVAGL